MTSLELRVNPIEGDNHSDRRVEMIAEITPVGRLRAKRRSRKLAITSGDALQIDDLSTGAWQIKVTLPSGRSMIRDVTLKSRGAKSVQFDDVDVAPRRSRDPISATRSSELSFLSPNLATARSLRPIGRITKPRSSVVELGGGGDPGRHSRWSAVTRLIGEPATNLGTPVSLSGSAAEGEWVISADDKVYYPPVRSALAVTTGNRTLLQSLPTPWDIFGEVGGLTVSISTAIDRLDVDVRVDEPGISGVISYLANGALQSAAELLERSSTLNFSDMLRGKVSNPLRACAAAYVLVGASDLSRPAEWHRWLDNLASWFDTIPDGLIILARFRQLTGNREAASQYLLEALARGLPHYTLGIVWLRDLMAMQTRDHPAHGYGELVNRVASYVDVSKPFTCLRWQSGR